MTLRPAFNALFIAAAVLACVPAAAQQYPDKLIRLVVPFPPGASTDLVARVTADYLSRKTGQQVIVENRSGAGGNVGSDFVAKSSPDGYTLLVVTRDPIVINPFIYKHMPFDPLVDLRPVAAVGEAPQLIVVNAQLPANNLQEFIALAKSQPGKLSYGSPGLGSTPHLGGDQFARLTGTQLVHVPYRGMAPAVTDLVGGRTQLLVTSTSPVLGFLQAGTVRALASATKNRLPFMSNVPTAAEAGLAGYELTTWFGLLAPKGTPNAIVNQINGHIADMMKDAGSRKRLDDNFLIPMPMSADQFSALIQSEYSHWQQVIREAGIQRE